MYDKNFVIVQVDDIIQTIKAIRRRGRPRKRKLLEFSFDATIINLSSENKRPMVRPSKIPLKLKDHFTKKKNITQDKNANESKQHNYNLRCEQNKSNLVNQVTYYMVRRPRVTKHAIAQQHLPLCTSNTQSLKKQNNPIEMNSQTSNSQNQRLQLRHQKVHYHSQHI